MREKNIMYYVSKGYSFKDALNMVKKASNKEDDLLLKKAFDIGYQDGLKVCKLAEEIEAK